MGGVRRLHIVIPAHLVTLGPKKLSWPRVCLQSAKDARVTPVHDEGGLKPAASSLHVLIGLPPAACMCMQHLQREQRGILDREKANERKRTQTNTSERPRTQAKRYEHGRTATNSNEHGRTPTKRREHGRSNPACIQSYAGD